MSTFISTFRITTKTVTIHLSRRNTISIKAKDKSNTTECRQAETRDVGQNTQKKCITSLRPFKVVQKSTCYLVKLLQPKT